MDYTALQPAFDKYRSILDPENPTLDWVRSISSPYLFDCQYGALDEDLFMEATREYLRIWIKSDYKPAHGIFSKAWGKKVAVAMMYLETRDHPALKMVN